MLSASNRLKICKLSLQILFVANKLPLSPLDIENIKRKTKVLVNENPRHFLLEIFYLHGDSVLCEPQLDLLDGHDGVVDRVPGLVHRPVGTLSNNKIYHHSVKLFKQMQFWGGKDKNLRIHLISLLVR